MSQIPGSDPRAARRERRRTLDALPPPDAAFLEAARRAVERAGIPPWEEFRRRHASSEGHEASSEGLGGSPEELGGSPEEHADGRPPRRA